MVGKTEQSHHLETKSPWGHLSEQEVNTEPAARGLGGGQARKLRNTNECFPEKRKNPVIPSATRDWSQPGTANIRRVFLVWTLQVTTSPRSSAALILFPSREWIPNFRQLVQSGPRLPGVSHHEVPGLHTISHGGFCGVFNGYWWDVRAVLQPTWTKALIPPSASSRAQDFPRRRQLVTEVSQGRDSLLPCAEGKKGMLKESHCSKGFPETHLC